MNKLEISLKRIEQLLLGNKPILSLEEFCAYTGFSKSFAYKLTSSRKLKFSCPNGKLIFFNRSDVDSFLLSNPTITVDDIEQEAINYVASKPWKGGAK